MPRIREYLIDDPSPQEENHELWELVLHRTRNCRWYFEAEDEATETSYHQRLNDVWAAEERAEVPEERIEAADAADLQVSRRSYGPAVSGMLESTRALPAVLTQVRPAEPTQNPPASQIRPEDPIHNPSVASIVAPRTDSGPAGLQTRRSRPQLLQHLLLPQDQVSSRDHDATVHQREIDSIRTEADNVQVPQSTAQAAVDSTEIEDSAEVKRLRVQISTLLDVDDVNDDLKASNWRLRQRLKEYEDQKRVLLASVDRDLKFQIAEQTASAEEQAQVARIAMRDAERQRDALQTALTAARERVEASERALIQAKIQLQEKEREAIQLKSAKDHIVSAQAEVSNAHQEMTRTIKASMALRDEDIARLQRRLVEAERDVQRVAGERDAAINAKTHDCATLQREVEKLKAARDAAVKALEESSSRERTAYEAHAQAIRDHSAALQSQAQALKATHGAAMAMEQNKSVDLQRTFDAYRNQRRADDYESMIDTMHLKIAHERERMLADDRNRATMSYEEAAQLIRDIQDEVMGAGLW